MQLNEVMAAVSAQQGSTFVTNSKFAMLKMSLVFLFYLALCWSIIVDVTLLLIHSEYCVSVLNRF